MMLSSLTFRHRVALRDTDLLRRAVGTLLCWVAASMHELRLRRDLRKLQALDDHLLHDIGVTRGALDRVVRSGRDPRDLPAGSATRTPKQGSAARPVSAWPEWR